MLSTLAGYVRANAIACLALFVALGGTSYAAIKLPKNSVGARQIKASAVTSSEVKNRSLKSIDFAAGQLPAGERGPAGAQGPQGIQGKDGPQGVPGPTFAIAQIAAGTDPPVSPDGTANQPAGDARRFDFTLPRAGTVLLRSYHSRFNGQCTVGARRVGLYLDGLPVAGTSKPVQLPASERAEEWIATVSATAGDHIARLVGDCPAGDPQSMGWDGTASWSAILLGD